MTFILFYLLEWAFQYLNKEAIKKKLPLALISLAVFPVGVVIAFPYISTRLGDLGTEGSSSYYRIVGPLVMVGYSLTHIDGVVRFGSLYEYVAHHSEYLTVRMSENHRQWFVSADYLFSGSRCFYHCGTWGK